MKKAILLCIFLKLTISFSQESSNYIGTISSEDSITLAGFKATMARHINPTPDSALFYSEKSKKFAQNLNYGIGIADSDYLIGICHKRLQQNDTAIEYFNNSLALSEQIGYRTGIARAYNSLCRTYYLQGRMEASVAACNKALENVSLDTSANTLIFADTHIALATAYARQNKLQEAVGKLLVVDSIHTITPLRPDLIAAAYQNLGNVYLELKDYDLSEAYYIKANDEFLKLPGDVSYYLNTTNINLGRVLLYKKQLSKADSVLMVSHSFFSAIKDERVLSEISTYLGQVNLEKGDSAKAEQFFKESLAIHKKNKRNYEASQNAVELAKLSLKVKEASTAIRYLEEAMDLNQTSNNSLIAQESNRLLAEGYAQKGDYKKALWHTNKAAQINDSLQQIQSVEKIREIEAIYQTETRDREIALLTSKNELAGQQKKNQRNIMLSGLGLTSIAGLFFFFQYRNRQKTNNKLKELDKAKSTFFANISHEFRTPLTLIKGPVEDQLASGNLSQNERNNLLAAHSNTKRLESLVEQLLALSKLESGNLKLKVQPGNISQFCKAQASAFTFMSQEKSITYQIDIDTTITTDWFDRDALEKIIYNLIGNAIKYTPENGSITVSEERDKDHYILSVANSGNYLNPDQLEKIFERFYQTDALNVGTGIGLALTKELVELHYGTISATSDVNGLTEFTMQIPIAQRTFNANDLLSSELRDSDNLDVSFSEAIPEANLSLDEDAPILLVVDDNKDIRNYVASIFDSTYKVLAAKNGQEGFEMALQHIPDVIISDVMMPKEDGFAFTDKIRSEELTAHIPVTLLTAKSEDTDRLKGLHSGADAYITKPFSSQLLLATISGQIDNRRKTQQRFAQEVILHPKEIAVSSADEQFIERLQKVTDEYLTNPDFSAELFGKEMGVSRMQLHRKLKALTGQSATELIRTQRLKLASNLLKEGKISISEIGYTVGFNDPSYFARCFKQEFGCAPSDF